MERGTLTQELITIDRINHSSHNVDNTIFSLLLPTNPSQSGVNLPNTQDSSKSLYGLSTEQLRQLAHVIFMMSPNRASGNNNAYANSAGLFPFFNALINCVFTKPWILDNGATAHIISDPELLTQSLPLYPFLIYQLGRLPLSLQWGLSHSTQT